MHGIDCSSHSIVAHLSDLLHLCLVEANVRGDDSDCGVRCLGWDASANPFAHIHETPSSWRSRPGNDPAIAGIDDIPHTIHSDQSPDNNTVADPKAGCSNAALHRKSRLQLSNGCSRSGANASFSDNTAIGCEARLVAGFRVRPDPRIPKTKVEENRGGNDRHLRKRRNVTDSVFFQITHDAGSRVQTERAA